VPTSEQRVETVALATLFPSPSNPRHNDDALPSVSGPANPSASPRKRQRVQAACPSCALVRQIIQECAAKPLPVCRSCAARLKPRKKRRGTTTPCATCGTRFYRKPCEAEKRYCSHGCASEAKRRYRPESRTCWTCGSQFTYTPKPHSNTAGHYCSVQCRNDGYLGVVHGDPLRRAAADRNGWRSRRDRLVRDGHDFCAVCGVRSGRLHVHHIEGYRNVQHDDLSTVVSLCPRHHALLERWTKCIVALEPVRRRHAALCILGCLGDSWAYHSGRALAQGGER